MSDMQDTDQPGDREALAAEYVLGLLSGDEAARFESQMAEDPELEQDVAAWAEYFTRFTDSVDEVTPPPQLWRRIEAAAFGRETRKPMWQLLWPYAAGAVAASVLAFAVYNTGLLDMTPQPHLYADLVAEEQGYVLLAHWAPDSETFMLRRDQGGFPQDNAIEIWVIPGPNSAPISVGLMAEAGLTQIPVPEALIPVMTPGATVALSLEPLGGSPTGAPTGPILATGPLGIRS
ncbi:anti-sigma factor [Primorskyibacter sp. 2E107]|uniref:anti-sigma factor n=1 Tax=Primorskyibacter sp. 2E107 TaxID=3403458 RepID=UPI003AF8FCCA